MIVSYPRIKNWIDRASTRLREAVRPIWLVACFLCCTAGWVTAQQRDDQFPAAETHRSAMAGRENASSLRIAAASSGNQVMRTVARAMATHLTIQAKIRIRTDVMGDPLIGSGSYAQLKASEGLYLRMELAIQAGRQNTSIKHISDGRTLWEHWRMGESVRVNRIDMKKVMASLRENPASVSMNSTHLATGGLTRLTHQLATSFDFDTRPVRVGSVGNDAVPVWIVSGQWKAKALEATVPQAIAGEKVLLEQLPKHLPHEVELVVDQKTFFPYRVAYQKRFDEEGETRLAPMVTTEFFEVAIDREVDPRQFRYDRPTNMHIADKTDVFLRSLGIANKPITKR